MRPTLLALLSLMALVAASSSCKQQQHDRCQRRSDCEPGLVCTLPASWTCPPSLPMCTACLVGGRCESPQSTDIECHDSSECTNGRTCRRSASCADDGRLTCSGASDMGPEPTD
jgi:hypothetical protein